MIPRPFFDRPLWTDPLWWFGIIGGLLGGIIYGLRADLGIVDFAWQLLAGVVVFTWWTAGLLLSTIRFHFRRRRASRRIDEPPRGPRMALNSRQRPLIAEHEFPRPGSFPGQPVPTLRGAAAG